MDGRGKCDACGGGQVLDKGGTVEVSWSTPQLVEADDGTRMSLADAAPISLQLTNPVGVAVSEKQDVFVSDSRHACVFRIFRMMVSFVTDGIFRMRCEAE